MRKDWLVCTENREIPNTKKRSKTTAPPKKRGDYSSDCKLQWVGAVRDGETAEESYANKLGTSNPESGCKKCLGYCPTSLLELIRMKSHEANNGEGLSQDTANCISFILSVNLQIRIRLQHFSWFLHLEHTEKINIILTSSNYLEAIA